MSKPLKEMVTDTLRRRFDGLDSACVVDLTGLDVVRTHRLRQELRAKSIRMHVVKNSLARRAFKGGPLEALGEALEGPSALVTGGTSVMDVAKELVRWSKEFPKLKLKRAIIEGERNLVPVEEVARMRGRRELIGELLMLISSPGRAIAGCAQSPGGKIAGCLKALAEKHDETAPAPG
ncbi:MAG TPA: 50S ribosomal protein L10 [Phycisphaerae bacterium]